MLTTCLQRHPDICSHGEVFGVSGPMAFYGIRYNQDPPLEQILKGIRDRDPVHFLEDFVFEAGSKRAAGMKLKYEELLLPRWEPVLARLRERTDVRVIHLTRENLLDRYLSQHVAVHVTKVYNVQQGPVPPPVRVRLDPDACAEDFSRTTEREALLRSMFAAHEVLEITYEQLVDSQESTLRAVQAFLGVEPIELEPTTKKLRAQSIAESVENFDELARRFVGTPYARFFEDAA
jgi:hypothetical protein